ncbi:hypothetical protein R1sor_002811 [Riccia sorocarpa]|uniref:Uncharacterized protein n=1 Tax=Riccia sorocarpa TaxID=122646 RepID=A0ABD3H3S3_9MARC
MEESDRTENVLDVAAAPSDSLVKSEPISTVTETNILEQPGGDVSVQANFAQPSGGIVVVSRDDDSGEDWEEEAFVLSIEHFEKECKLPSHGIHPAEIPKSLITDEQLVSCFGTKSGKNGHNEHRWDLSKVIPHADILSIVQVIDGHERLVNGTIGVESGGLAAPNACSDLFAESPDVRSMAIIQIENTDILKLEIKQYENTKMCLGSAFTKLKDSQSRFNQHEKEFSSSIDKYESTISSEVLKQGDLVKKESERNRRKSEIELDTVMQLEIDEQEVNVQISHVLDSIATSKYSYITASYSNAHQLIVVKVEEKQGPVGKTSGSKKRKGVKGSEDVPLCPRKVKTRHATKSEIGTGIDSSSQYQRITLKSYKAIDTPPAISKTKDSRRKLSLDKVRQMRFHRSMGMFDDPLIDGVQVEESHLEESGASHQPQRFPIDSISDDLLTDGVQVEILRPEEFGASHQPHRLPINSMSDDPLSNCAMLGELVKREEFLDGLRVQAWKRVWKLEEDGVLEQEETVERIEEVLKATRKATKEVLEEIEEMEKQICVSWIQDQKHWKEKTEMLQEKQAREIAEYDELEQKLVRLKRVRTLDHQDAEMHEQERDKRFEAYE